MPRRKRNSGGIGEAIAKGAIHRASSLVNLINKLKQSGGTCHLIGLVSPGGVHSHQDHAVALAKILSGLYVPESGEIRLNGERVDNQNRDDYRQIFSAVFSVGNPVASHAFQPPRSAAVFLIP